MWFIFILRLSCPPPQWNISDYFFQRGEAITLDLEREEAAVQKQARERGETLNRPFHPAPPFDCLWLCLYAKLGELCVDLRPAVRKSAGQTLFSTIAAHGTLLQQATWHVVVWKVRSAPGPPAALLPFDVIKGFLVSKRYRRLFLFVSRRRKTHVFRLRDPTRYKQKGATIAD